MEIQRALEKSEVALPRRGVLVDLLEQHAVGEGFSPSRLPNVKFMRSTSPVFRTRVAYDPSIVIIASGRKRGYMGDKVFTYDANHFLVLSVPLPFDCETLASPEEPMLGISVGVSPAVVTELMMEMERPLPIPQGRPQAILSNPVDDDLYEVAVRLVKALGSKDDAHILGPQIVREITYRVLSGGGGGPLRALVAPNSQFGQISRALHRIHADFATPLEMATLAREAGMSISTFHTHFKAVTSSPPLQYLKAVRLHKARLLMVQNGETAASASQLVGYESTSQFNREFKRFFGETPAKEAEKIKTSLIKLV